MAGVLVQSVKCCTICSMQAKSTRSCRSYGHECGSGRCLNCVNVSEPAARRGSSKDLSRGHSRVSLSLMVLALIVFGLPRRASASSLSLFQFPGSIDTNASGVNTSGQIVGTYQVAEGVAYGTYGFIRNADGTFLSFSVPQSNGGNGLPSTYAYGINDSGEVVGTINLGDNVEDAFLRNVDGSFDLFSIPGADATLAEGINNTGNMVVDAISGTGVQGVTSYLRTPDGTYTALSNNNWDIEALGLDNSGDIVGLYVLPGDTGCDGQGFVYSGGSYSTVDVPGACQTIITGINDLGQIVGYAYFGDTLFSFVGSADGSSFTLLAFPGGTVSGIANGINNGGAIVGDYQGIGFYEESPITSLPTPEPSTVALCALCTIPAILSRKVRWSLSI
jgi:hypothetical protein